MVEHASIIDSERHEAKGASTATANQVLHANGDGTTTFKFLDYDDLVNKPVVGGYEAALLSANVLSQNPTVLGTPIKVSFGSGLATEFVQLASDGTLTFLSDGQYLISVFLRFGRTTGAGSAVLLSRVMYNNSQVYNTNCIKLTDVESITPFSATLLFDAQADDTVHLELVRDSSGVDNGGLVATTPLTAGWPVSPSATIAVYKLSGE